MIINIDPVLFSLGPFTIRYYGFAYLIGFIAAWWALKKYTSLTKDEAESFITWAVISTLLGARIFYFLFYAPSSLFTLSQLGSIPVPTFFAVWLGGMSFHGGLVGIAIGGLWWTRKHKKNFYEIADTLSIVAAFGLALGRLANFTNSEIVGTPTNLPWCMEFPRAPPPLNYGCRHPAMLYGAIKDTIIGGLLILLRKKEVAPGTIFWSFVSLYGLLRFIVQFVRTDPVVFLGLQAGHLLSLAILVVGIIMLVRVNATTHLNKKQEQ